MKYIKSIWKVVVRASCIYIRREKKFFNGCINVQAAFSLFLLGACCALPRGEIYLCDRRVDR